MYLKIRRIDLPDTKLDISLQYLLSQTGFGSLCKDPVSLRKVLVHSQFLKSRTGSNYVGKTKLCYVIIMNISTVTVHINLKLATGLNYKTYYPYIIKVLYMKA